MSFEALNKAREEDGGAIDFCCEKNPRCPHCGETYAIDENEAFWLYDQQLDTVNIECASCELEFTTMVTVYFSYSTDEADDDQ